MGKGRTKPTVMPIDRTGEDRPSLFVGWIDALPVPAALIRPMDRGNFSLHASNSAFDRLDLSPAGVDAPFELRRAIERAAQGGAGTHEFSCRLGKGVAARDLRGSVALLTDENGATSLFLLTLIDRTQEMMVERNLRRELVSDSLTGLPNRAGFEELVEQRQDSEGSGDHAILLLDLARFSRINEHIGPMAGDELIITVARRLKSSLRSGDILARTGGDEFAISSRVPGGRADDRRAARRLEVLVGPPRGARDDRGAVGGCAGVYERRCGGGEVGVALASPKLVIASTSKQSSAAYAGSGLLRAVYPARLQAVEGLAMTKDMSGRNRTLVEE